MAGFQFTPNGIAPLGDESAGQQPNYHPAAPPAPVAVAPKRVSEPTAPPEATQAAQPAQQTLPIAPAPDVTDLDATFDVEKAARARLKVLNEEIKRLSKLKRERDRLQRLLKAARQKPANNVRSLRSA